MGWTSYNAYHYKSNGTIDVKKEMDSKFNWEYLEVVKSSVVGSTYYAAIKNKRTGEVFAVICLTSLDKSDGMNFGYKDMDETEMPFQYKCPKSILKLLTPTDNTNANEWRERCWEYHTKPKLSDVKIGQKIKWKVQDKEYVLIKREPNRQFKRAWWYCQDENAYVDSKNILSWELINDVKDVN